MDCFLLLAAENAVADVADIDSDSDAEAAARVRRANKDGGEDEDTDDDDDTDRSAGNDLDCDEDDDDSDCCLLDRPAFFGCGTWRPTLMTLLVEYLTPCDLRKRRMRFTSSPLFASR